MKSELHTLSVHYRHLEDEIRTRFIVIFFYIFRNTVETLLKKSELHTFMMKLSIFLVAL